ncbi:MAG: MFS transporter [Planctomycetales bacterium]|nr:MFS transporter [Planctomycetales bacterium]
MSVSPREDAADPRSMSEVSAAASSRLTPVLLALAWAMGHFSLGIWVVTLGSYIKANTGEAGSGMFSDGFVGAATAAGPLGAIVAPFLAGMLADRLFSTERILVALHLLCAVALGAAIRAPSQPVFHATLMAYFVCMWPTMSLLASMSMYHLPDPRKQYPLVRGCGTVGWIVAGLLVGSVAPWMIGHSVEATILPMKLGMAAEIVAAALCVFLPHTPPSVALRKLAPGAIVQPQTGRLLQNRQFIAVLLVAFLAFIPAPFYHSYANPFLNWRGVSQAASRMTLGQLVEVISMVALPAVLLRIGLRQAVMWGVSAWVLRYLLLAGAAGSGGHSWAVYLAIAMHGVAFTFVAISLQIEVAQLVDPRRRATAQGLLAATTSGLGSYVGAQIASVVETHWLPGSLQDGEPAGWAVFWLVPAVAAIVAFLAVALFLPEAHSKSPIVPTVQQLD